MNSYQQAETNAETPEQELIMRARHDEQAFSILYRRYFPRLYAYVSYRVARTQDAEDIVAETFMRVVEGLGYFKWKHEGSFAGWIFRIAHNLLTDRYRQQYPANAPVALDDLPEIAANALLPDEVVLRKEQFARLHGLIAGLPPRRQEVITLKFFGALRNQEIAAVLGLDQRTVASHLCRALEELNQQWLTELAEATKENQNA